MERLFEERVIYLEWPQETDQWEWHYNKKDWCHFHSGGLQNVIGKHCSQIGPFLKNGKSLLLVDSSYTCLAEPVFEGDLLAMPSA